MSNTKRLEDVMKNLQTTAEVSRQSQKINLPQVNPLTGEAWTPTPEQYNQAETYADVQNRIGNASQRLSYVGEDPTKITDSRNFIEKGLNLPEGQNAIFDVFEMLQRGQQAMFAMIAPPKVSEGMGSYQKWAQENRKRLKDSGLLDDSPMITDKDGKQRIREIHETSAYKQYLKEGGTPATETGLSEDPWKNMRDKIDEASDILGGKSQLYGGELIRRWMNVTDQDKAKEDGTLDWTDFAGFYLDMAFLDPGDVALPVFKVLGKRSKLTEKGVEVVKQSAKEAGFKLTKEGIETALIRKGAPGRVKDAKKFVNTLKEVSQITFKAGDTARVVKEGGVTLNRFIWHKVIDTTAETAKLGNGVAIKMMSAVDPTIAKSYQNFLGHTMDTLGRGGKQLNQIVSKAINNKRRLAVALDFESKQFDKFFQETYEKLDLSEIKTQLSRIDVDKLTNFDELSPRLQDLFLDDTVFESFKEAFLKMGDVGELDNILQESMKRSLFKHTVNYREFMELARKGMKGYDFVDYMINDSKKVLNYTPEGEVLFRSIFDNYDDIVKVVDAENGLKMFKFDDEFFGEGNRKVLEDIIATRTVQIGETSIDSFSRNQIQSINRALKKLDIDPKTATPAQKRLAFVSLKQPARISYLLEQAKEFNNLHLFVKEYAKEIEMIVGFQNDANIVGVKNFMKSLQEMGDIEGYADVRLAVFDILSEFSPKTLATKAEMLGVDISGVHKYMDDVMPKPPEINLNLDRPKIMDVKTVDVPTDIRDEKALLDIISKPKLNRDNLLGDDELVNWVKQYYKNNGTEAPDDILETLDDMWLKSRYDKATPALKPISGRDGAVKLLHSKVPANVYQGWFGGANSNYKTFLVQAVMDDPEAYNASMNIMWENYKQLHSKIGLHPNYKKGHISFKEFLDTEIPLYRGTYKGKPLVDDDVFSAYSMDETIARRFATSDGTVETIKVKPRDTFGSFNDWAEKEVLVPTKPIKEIVERKPDLKPKKVSNTPKISKVVGDDEIGNVVTPDKLVFSKEPIPTKFDPHVEGYNFGVKEVQPVVYEKIQLNKSSAITSDGKLLTAKDHNQIAKALTQGGEASYDDVFKQMDVIYYSSGTDGFDGLTILAEPTQTQLDKISFMIKRQVRDALEEDVSMKARVRNGLRVYIELPGDGQTKIITINPQELKSVDSGELVVNKIKEHFINKVPVKGFTKKLAPNTVALSKEQTKLLKLKKSNKLGKMGDELVATVEKKASELGITKLSPEEIATLKEKTLSSVPKATGRGIYTEWVKLDDILPFAEFNRAERGFTDLNKLSQDIKLNGFQEPIILEVNPETGFAFIGEGNHRLAVAVALGLDEIPVRTLRAKFAEPVINKGGWFIDNTILPSHTTFGTKYIDFYEAKPSVVGLPSRPFGLASKVPTPEVPGKQGDILDMFSPSKGINEVPIATTKPGLKLNKEVAKRLSEAQEFEQYALKEIKEFANKLLDYKITVGGQEIKLVDFLGEESKEFIMDATDGGKKNVIQAFRQMAETNPALKAFLDDQTWADLMGKQEFDILTGTSIIPKSSKPIFSLPAPNFYTPKDLEYFKKLSTNSTVEELSRKYGETITKMQEHIGRVEFGDSQALVKASMKGYTPHVMHKANKVGEDVMQTLDTIDEELLLREIKGMFKKAGLPQENADLFMFGRNKTLAGREFSMSAREANNVRNALLIESVQKSKAFEKLDPDAQMEITDYIKKGLFSEDASDTLVAMTTKKMTAINYGNKNIQILAQMSFGDVDNQYVQFVLGNKKPKQAGMEALSDPQLRQVIKSLNTMIDVTGGDEYTQKLLKMFKKANTKQGTIYMDKHLIKQMVVGASKDAPAFLKFIDTFNGYFKAGKTLSPMFNVQNMVGNWSNMWFSGMKADEIAKGYGRAVSDYTKFKKILGEVTDLKTLETSLQGADKKLFDEIMYFMDNGFFTGNTALELQDVQKMLNQMDNAKGVKALVKKASDATGMAKISEANMNLNLFNDNVNRLTLFRHAKNNPEFIKSLGLKLTGDSNADAMNAVRFVLFDPNDLSFFEQDYMKRLIPFYTFQRQNLAFQTQNFVRKSDRYYKVWKTYEGAWNEKGMETNDLMQYEQDRMLLPIPYAGKDGQYTALRVSTPFVDALEFMSISGAFNKIMSSTTPLVRAPYESASGVSTFTGEPIERYKDEQSTNLPFMTKGAEWALGHTGLDVPMRVATHGILGVANAVTGNNEDIGQNISKATGVVGAPRTVIQNEVAKSYEKLEQLDDLLKKVKEKTEVPTITQIQKLSTNNKYDDMIQQQKRLSDLINGLKR